MLQVGQLAEKLYGVLLDLLKAFLQQSFLLLGPHAVQGRQFHHGLLLLVQLFLGLINQQSPGGNFILVNDPQVLGVLLVLPPLPIPFRRLFLALLHESPQYTHTFMNITWEVETVEFPQSQLTLVVIETLLGDSDHPGRVLQVHPATQAIHSVQVQVPPSLDQLDGLSDGAFLTTTLPSLTATLLLQRGGVKSIRVHPELPTLKANEDDTGFKVLLVNESVIGSDLGKGGEGVAIGVIDGDTVVRKGTVSGEEVIEVNKIVSEVQLAVHDQRLLRLLLLEHEGPMMHLGEEYVQHQNQFFWLQRADFQHRRNLINGGRLGQNSWGGLEEGMIGPGWGFEGCLANTCGQIGSMYGCVMNESQLKRE